MLSCSTLTIADRLAGVMTGGPSSAPWTNSKMRPAPDQQMKPPGCQAPRASSCTSQLPPHTNRDFWLFSPMVHMVVSLTCVDGSFVAVSKNWRPVPTSCASCVTLGPSRMQPKTNVAASRPRQSSGPEFCCMLACAAMVDFEQHQRTRVVASGQRARRYLRSSRHFCVQLLTAMYNHRTDKSFAANSQQT